MTFTLLAVDSEAEYNCLTAHAMSFLPLQTDFQVETEGGQATIRVMVSFIAALLHAATFAVEPGWIDSSVVVCLLGYAFYSYVWIWIVARRVGPDIPRQWCALAMDNIICFVCFYFGGRTGCGLLWVPAATGVGHGLRFGETRGVISALAGGLSIAVAMKAGPNWDLPNSVVAGFVVSAVVIPIYVTRLVRSLEHQRRDANARAASFRHAAHTDALTGLPNRAGLEDAWSGLSDDAGISTVPVGVIYLDLDGFKAVNDTFGHDVGDQLLCLTAGLLSKAVRSTDRVARIGGDEFVILICAPNSASDVESVAAKASAAVDRLELSPRCEASVRASAGAAYFEKGCSLAVALRQADERMFATKRRRKSMGA